MITHENKNTKQSHILHSSYFDTPLGTMLAIADDHALYCLTFVESKKFEGKIEQIRQKTASTIVPGTTEPIKSIAKELTDYFDGTLKEFKTPLALLGSPFQQSVWQALQKIPFGKTTSYLNLAQSLGKPTAFRAIAQANGANQLAIIIPCHRVINANGALGGYASGLMRKEWLLNHETLRV